MTTIWTILLVLGVWSGPALAVDLPPAVLADQYWLEGLDALEHEDVPRAVQAFEKIEALAIEPPLEFLYLYGKILVEYVGTVEAVRKGQTLLQQFVVSEAQGSKEYMSALKLLTRSEAQLPELEAAAQQEAERKKLLPGILDELNAQMVTVQGGTFTMGCLEKRDLMRDIEKCRKGELPAHTVRVSGFEISRYEITQVQWATVMGMNPSYYQPKNSTDSRTFNVCLQCPVDSVSWNDVQAFLEQLNELTGERYRLPTEAEWEYAARGGLRSRGYRYAGSNAPGAVGWHSENSGRRTHPVGQKQPNEVGLYDMSGNVAEWVQDCPDYEGAPTDGSVWTTCRDNELVLRGGGFPSNPSRTHSAARGWYPPDGSFIIQGFRVARTRTP